MRILFVAAEIEPEAKVGGLADVIGALPTALAGLGHDVRIALPHYPLLDESLRSRREPICKLGDDRVLRDLDPDVTVAMAELTCGLSAYLIRSDRWFGQGDQSERLYTSDAQAYVVFGRVAALLGQGADPDWIPDIVHAHDWHTGMAMVYLAQLPRSQRPALVYTVHNLAYTGQFGSNVMEAAHLPWSRFTWDGLEYYGGFSFLKAGIVSADMVTTVSDTYAREVQTPEYGGGLEGLMAYLHTQGRFVGIVNGIDAKRNDPWSDASLAVPYAWDDISGKRECKAQLQTDMGLRVSPRTPIIGMVSRICEQKGHDLVSEAVDDLVDMGVQLAILGVGDETMSAALQDASKRRPGEIGVRIGFDAYLASRVYAGSDLFLMPSRFEPCGLGQMIALRYGSVPVVRRTGGLADTIRDIGEFRRTGNGLLFEAPTPADIVGGVARAVSAYRDKRRWERIVRRGMAEDHDWSRVAPEYERIYRRAFQVRGGETDDEGGASA